MAFRKTTETFKVQIKDCYSTLHENPCVWGYTEKSHGTSSVFSLLGFKQKYAFKLKDNVSKVVSDTVRPHLKPTSKLRPPSH